MCALFSSLKICVSASYFNKKCDEFGSTFNENLLAQKKKEEKSLEEHYCDDIGNGDFGPEWKIAFDNFDVHQRVREIRTKIFTG